MFNDDWTSDAQCTLVSVILQSLESLEGEILEIGTWEGKLSVHIANTAFPKIIHCVDWWKGNVSESLVTGSKHLTEIILETRNVREIFEQNIMSCTNGNVSIHSCECNEWLQQLDSTFKIKFCYLDASHDYISVRDTLTLLLPYMVPGGVICGSDFIGAGEHRSDLQGGVQRAVKEILPTARNVENTWLYQHFISLTEEKEEEGESESEE